MKKLKVVLIGAGSRGIIYTDYMAEAPDKYEIVAVAEPIDNRRNYIKEKHGLDDSMCFTTWEPLLDLGKIADIAIIATMDRDHMGPALKAMEVGYDLLLEKPIAPNPQDCKKLMEHAKKHGRKAVVCTVLRYSTMYMKLKEIIDSGRIGEIMSINHEECVGNRHQSHSFVRGNWGNEGRSSCMLLQKSCHDMDILQWLIGKKCKKVQSFGALSHFTSKNAPADAPDYCIDGCPHEEECFYSTLKIYLNNKENIWGRGAAAGAVNPTDEQVEKALRTTQYGRCAYKCDNDVVDHQTVNMLFEDDVTVTFTMNAFNRGRRNTHIMGTKGEIEASLDGATPIKIYDFSTQQVEEISVEGKDGIVNGHGGGDPGIVNTLYEYMTGNYTGKSVPDIITSCENHLTTFAAEHSRKTGTIVDLDEYIESL